LENVKRFENEDVCAFSNGIPTDQTTPKTENPAQDCTTSTRPQPIRVTPQPGRDATCQCGSGVKFKRFQTLLPR
jgi:hypothetical protein